jgi:hypothetical protein
VEPLQAVKQSHSLKRAPSQSSNTSKSQMSEKKKGTSTQTNLFSFAKPKPKVESTPATTETLTMKVKEEDSGQKQSSKVSLLAVTSRRRNIIQWLLDRSKLPQLRDRLPVRQKGQKYNKLLTLRTSNSGLAFSLPMMRKLLLKKNQQQKERLGRPSLCPIVKV